MTKALRKEGVDHPYVGELKRQLADKEIGRRDFLQTATMLGMSATAGMETGAVEGSWRTEEGVLLLEVVRRQGR